MTESRPETTADEAQAAGAVIVTAILCLCALALLLLWMSGWSNTARPGTGPGETGEWFGPVAVVVGVLDLFALVSVVLRLFHSPRAPSGRWGFGAGLLAMLLAIAGAAFVANDLLDGVMRNLVRHCSGAAIGEATRLLALGAFGVLVLAAGALGFALGLFGFLGEVGSGAWLSVGAFVLLFSTIAFLAIVTVGAVAEFARHRPRADPELSW